MKVMHIFGNFGPGGAEVGVLRLIESLRKEAIEHSICSIKSSSFGERKLPPGAHFYSLNVERSNRVIFMRLSQLLKKTKTDIAHVNNLAPWFDVALASKLAGCSCVETFHGVEENIARFSAGRRFMQRMAASLTKEIATVSYSTRQKLEELSGIKKDQVKVVMNGVDIDVFKPLFSEAEREASRRDLHLPEKECLIGCVAALRPVKDHMGLLKAFVRFQNRYQGGARKDCYLVLVGDGILRRELETQSSRLNIGNRVLFLGRRDHIEKIIPLMDIFVLNSQTEGMSYALLEAMSSGVPIIATDVGANRELISQGVEGYLYPREDLDRLVDYLVSLAENEPLLRKMGERAREKVVNHFSLDKMALSYGQLYREVLVNDNRKG